MRQWLATRLALMAALGACSGPPPERSRDSDRPIPPNTTSTRPAPSGSRTPWLQGERHTYQLRLTSTLAFGDGPKVFDFDVTGDLVVAAASAHEDEASLFVVLVEPKVRSRVPDPKGQFEALAQQLSQFGCYFSFKGGREVDMRVAPGLPPMVVNVYRQLGAALQVVPDSSGQTRYQAREYDGTGEYTAEYERKGERSLEKRKLRYLGILAKAEDRAQPALAGVTPEVVSSRGELELSTNGRPQAVRMSDELRINGAQLPVHTTVLLSLTATSTVRNSPVQDWPALSTKLTRLAADEPLDTKAPVEALDEARINGQTLDSLITKLERQPSAQELPGPGATEAAVAAAKEREQRRAAEDSPLFVALTALFREDAGASARAVQKARANPAVANTLIDSMGSSGSPSAHAALARLLTTKGIDGKLRLRALTALARTPVPSVVAVDALKEELERSPFSTGALYGLGSYALYFHNAGDTARERELGELLLDRLAHADDIVPRLIVTLGGITNSGYLGALQAVHHHLQDRRPGVRAAAVRSLQFMRGADVDGVIANVLGSDTEVSVTLAALDAAQAREASDALAHALSELAQHGENPNARFKSVTLLSQWRRARPELRQVLERVAVSDSEERVRAQARAAL